MAQIYMGLHQDSNTVKFRAWTDGSPGAESDPVNDTRIVNFVHTDDLVTMAPFLFSADPAARLAARGAWDAYAVALGVSADLTLVIEDLIKNGSAKHRAGTDVLLDSDRFTPDPNSLNPLDVPKFLEHDTTLYIEDVEKLLSFARSGVPFADTPIARSLLADEPSLAAAPPSTPYTGQSSLLGFSFGPNAIQIGVGDPVSSFVHALASDDYVLGGVDAGTIYLPAFPKVVVDGGVGNGDIVNVPGTPDQWTWTFSAGSNKTALYHYSALVGTLYNIDLIQFADGSTKSALSTFGRAAEGYLSGATVFADANGNGKFDTGESSATTDANGTFIVSGGTGPLIAFGGTDTSTGVPFNGQLSAPTGSIVITPLTTMLTAAGDQDKLLAALGLPAGIDLTTLDPIAAAQVGDVAGAAVYVAGAKVMDTVAAIAAAIADLGGNAAIAQHDAFLALAAAVNNLGQGQALDLANTATIAALFTGVALNQGIDVGQFTDAVAGAIAASNAALDHQLELNLRGDALLSGVSAAQLVVQGNHTPTATDDLATAASGIGGAVNKDAAHGVLANDSDPDGDTLAVTGFTGGTYGSLVLNPDGSYGYTADNAAAINAAATGSHLHDVFTYGVSDGHGGVASANLDITLDRGPSVTNDFTTATSGIGGTASGNVLGNDSDPDGDTLAVTGFTGGSYGSLLLNADGSYSYAADNAVAISAAVAGSHLHDIFTYGVSDGHGGVASANLDITLNRVPHVTPQSASVGEDGPNFSPDLLIGASDPDQSDVLTVVNLDASLTTSGGRSLVRDSDYTLTGSTLALTAAGFAKFNSLSGSQTDQAVFHFGVSDGAVATTDALTLTITGANDAPNLVQQTLYQTATAGTAFSLVLPATAFQDPDNGDHLTLSATQNGGTALPSWLTFNPATGSFNGTPGAGDVGSIGLKVTATDSGGLSAFDTFQIGIAAATTNNAPTITSDGGRDAASIIIAEDSRYVTKVHATDSDPGTSIKYSIVGGADQKLFAIDPKTGVLSFKSEPRDGHDYQVTVVASDGTLQDTQALKVHVADGPFMVGNPGVSDMFVFKPHFGLEIVNSFDANSPAHDVLELDHALFRNSDANMTASAVQALVQNHSFQFGHDVMIMTDTHDFIDLRNTDLHKLTAGDFVLI